MQKSFTIDEHNWLIVGQDLIRDFNWDSQIKRNHPPLTFYLHGLSSLFLETTDSSQQLLWARLTMQPFLIFFGLSLFIYTKKILDKKAALLAVLLFCLSTEMLAHGRLITKDFVQSFFIFISLMEFYFFLKEAKLKRVFRTGIFLALALLTKYSAFLLVPLFISLFGFYNFYFKKRPKVKKALLLIFVFLIAVFIINLGYLFKGSFSIPQTFETRLFQGIKDNFVLSKALFLLPKPYLQGFDHVYHDSQTNWGHSFFWGENRNGKPGLWYFFLVSFFIKTPIALIILFLSGLLIIIFAKNITEPFFLYYNLFIVGFYFFYLSFFLNLIIGFRYALVVYPFIFIIAAWAMKKIWLEKPKRLIVKGTNLRRVVIVFLLAWYIRETLIICPHFLAYANQLVGGPKKAYLYYADSNLDWGQDWQLIHKYLKLHPQIHFDPKKPTVGKIAVNVNSYNLYNYSEYLWLRRLNKEPVDWIGYTWLIFEITKEDLRE